MYCSFVESYPDFFSIKKVGLKKIKRELYSLGLEWRAIKLYEMTKIIIEKYEGKLPLNKEELLDLPGIGDYIASAVLCFGYNLSEPLLDTNTVRVIGRLFNYKITDSSRRNKKFKDTMRSLVTCDNPRLFSLAMLDLAALICLPQKPKCKECPVNRICSYFENLK